MTELDTLGHGVKERLRGIRECWGVDEEMDESDMQMMGEDFVAARHDFAFMFDQLAKAEYRYHEVKEINQNKGVVMSRSSELSQLGSRLAAAQSREEISTEKQEPTECQKIHLLTPTGERTWSEVIIRVPQNVRIEVRRLRE
uniref:Uncharacterized protein n=1 Tax=viral metagenome TaxID=1070528 RepID=A0A6M3L1X2_9ZZZZ